jgi:hypothetical protein
MKTIEEIQDQINLYKHMIVEWQKEDDEYIVHNYIPPWMKVRKLIERLIQELEWVLK